MAEEAKSSFWAYSNNTPQAVKNAADLLAEASELAGTIDGNIDTAITASAAAVAAKALAETLAAQVSTDRTVVTGHAAAVEADRGISVNAALEAAQAAAEAATNASITAENMLTSISFAPSTYYTKTEADGRYYTKTQADASYDTKTSAASLSSAHGKCTLTSPTTSTVRLEPFNGNTLVINGAVQVVPSPGVTLSASGLTVGTCYYVYAYMNGSTMTLEASTAAYTTSTSGIAVKTGDATRTLVGAVYCHTGNVFSDTNVFGYRSWFNEPSRTAYGVGSAFAETASPTYTTTNSDAYLLMFPFEPYTCTADARISSPLEGSKYALCGIGLAPDPVTALSLVRGYAGYSNVANQYVDVFPSFQSNHSSTLSLRHAAFMIAGAAGPNVTRAANSLLYLITQPRS